MKSKLKIILPVLFGLMIVAQQFGVLYRREHADSREQIDAAGNDIMAAYEIGQLEELWRKADVSDLVTPEKMANVEELERARERLKEAAVGIAESQKRVQGVTGKKQEFFQKAHDYYNHSVEALSAIIDFLLAKKDTYSVKGTEISFDNEADASRFRELAEALSRLEKEKAELDAFISNHNDEVRAHSQAHP